ncbi:hypothetical protein J7E68_15170 [Microbacterium sp. ISL-103]|uniref:hypothetical protein n=1 Tax=Microbacterium sp. ISL-103 TaxID=2819156 RepID=UPI001BEC690D|nr:hypothetical protein [Microbacterium sp. ISL-103]MBT2475878.1 hypothetical protein [Microbacterium sp. ISL-103]
MGKAKRQKTERSAVKAIQTPQDPFELLQEAVVAVGDAFGEEPSCAEAAAMMVMVGRELGFALTPRPVSLLAHDHRTGDFGIMGPKATAMVPEGRRDQLEDLRPGGKDNGHLVVTLADPKLLIDANLRQLGKYGMPAPSIMMRIRSTEPESGEWAGRFGDLELLYILDEDHQPLLRDFDRLLDSYRDDARHLVEMLKAGMNADQVRTLLNRRE